MVGGQDDFVVLGVVVQIVLLASEEQLLEAERKAMLHADGVQGRLLCVIVDGVAFYVPLE